MAHFFPHILTCKLTHKTVTSFREQYITIMHSMCIGGHYFSRVTFSHTLNAIITEHFFGAFVTNAEQSTTGIVLFKLLRAYEEIMTWDEPIPNPYVGMWKEVPPAKRPWLTFH